MTVVAVLTTAAVPACTGRSDVRIGIAGDADGIPAPNGGTTPPITSDASTPSPPDAAPIVDAAPPPPDAPPPITSCDADGDGYRATAPVCGGDDCCDKDPLVYPRETEEFYYAPSLCGDFRFVCGKAIVKQYAVIGCHFEGRCTGSGFVQETACGDVGQYVPCVLSRGRCIPDSNQAERRIQGCR